MFDQIKSYTLVAYSFAATKFLDALYRHTKFLQIFERYEDRKATHRS